MREPQRRRTGATYLELQVSLLVLCIALAGLCPLVVMQSRLLMKFEAGSPGGDNLQVIRGVQVIDGEPYTGAEGDPMPPPAILQPRGDGWVRRLGVAASFVNQAAPQTFTVAPVEMIVDDSDAAFAAAGWTVASNAMADNGGYHKTGGSGSPASASAVWTFGPIAPGWYRVTASWPAATGNTTTASYSFLDGRGAKATISVDQTVASGDGGSPWTDLGSGSPFFLGPSCVVALAPSTTGATSADAIRLVPLSSVTISTPATYGDAGSGASVSVQVAPRQP
jgi:hypothetical protein